MVKSKMWLDTDIVNQPPNTNRESYNINNYVKPGSITQELGTTTVSTYNKQPLFILPINNDDIVLFNLDNTIGLIHDGNYIQKYISSSLAFTNTTIINADYYINNKGERIIIFVYNKGNKQFNIDTLEFEDLLNSSTAPTITSTVLNYGNLAVGGYKLFIRYVKNDKSVTNFFKSYEPIIITDSKDSGSITNKSIYLNITNLDTSYKYVELGYVFVKDSVQTAYIIKKFDVKASIVYTITENENKATISLDELLNDNIIYKNINSIKLTKDYLYGYGVSYNKEADNIQTLTNALTLKWYSELKTPTRSTNIKTFAHGETYAFFIRYKFKWGYSKWYVCIGRTSSGTEKDSVTINSKTYLKYQVEDTCSTIGSHLTGTKGNFSFWENVEEDYPLDMNLPTGKVRHFKFPTVNWMRNNLYTTDSYGIETFDSLGVFIDNINLSLIKDNNNVAAYDYEIGYAKRNPFNSLVVGQSIQIFNDRNQTANDDGKYTNANYFNNGGNFISSYNGNNNYKQLTSFRTYPLEILVNKNDISIDSFREELKLTALTSHINSNANNNPLHDTYSFTNTITDYMIGSGGVSTALATNYKNTVNKSQLILNNTIREDINNIYGETHYNINCTETLESLTDGSSPILAGKKVINTPFVVGGEKTKLITLLHDNKNCYNDLVNQEIIAIAKNNNNIFTSGDCYINKTDVVLFGTYVGAYREFVESSNSDDKQGLFEGNVCIKSFISESLYNFNGIRDTYVQHYTRAPIINLLYFITLKRDADPNLFDLSINKDYTIFNDLVYSPVTKQEDNIDSDYFIIRSGNLLNNSYYNSREFNPDDRYLVPKNKGKVINIEEGQDFLYIHTEYSLFRTVGTNKAVTDNTDNLLYIKIGDIFQTPIYEIQHSELGLLGTKHKYSCCLTEYGYCFIDIDKKKMFLVNQSVKVLSNDGLNNKFKELLDNSIQGSPFIGESIVVEFDEYTERLFVVINGTCLVYSFAEQGWLCFTTYVPKYIFKSRSNLYSLFNNKIYKHNDTKRLNYVYGEHIDSRANVVLNTVDEKGSTYLINGIRFSNSVFDALRFKNSYQDTAEVNLIEISNEANLENLKGNVRKFQGYYYFYMIRDFCTLLGLKDTFLSVDVIMRGTEQKELSNIQVI